MLLKVIRTSQEFDALADQWNDLLDCSASHVPFLRHEYLATWWRTLGGGEWTNGDLYVVLGYRPDGSLGAIAPLFYTQNKDGEPSLMLLGSVEISDYLDFILCDDTGAEFVDALLDHLGEPPSPPWKVLDLYNLLESSPTLKLLESAALRRGWQTSQARLQHCPYIALPGDWETYLTGIDKKQRHEIRRKMRRAEAYEIPVRWYFVREASGLDAHIESFLLLMEQDEEKRAFLTPVMREQMRSTIRLAFQGGWLQLAFLEAGGEKVAAYLSFDYGNHIWVYNSGLNHNYSALSPGWVLLGYLLQWANENRRDAFDFMRGDEDYKYRFGAIDRYVVRLRVTR